MMNWLSKIGIFILAASLFVVASTNVFFYYRFVYEPLSITDTKVVNPEVKFGEPLIVMHTYNRRAYCKVDIDRFVIRLPDETLVRRERLPAGTTKLGISTRHILIPTRFPSQTVLPLGLADPIIADLVPGTSYRLREFVHSDCGDRLHTAIAPDVEFKVVE